MDCMLALGVIIEYYHEFGHGLFVVYIDLKKVYDPVHRKSILEILRQDYWLNSKPIYRY